MPAVTFADFSGGLDRRLPINVQDANRLWTLRNAYITAGKRIAKRPALRLLRSDLTGTFGLQVVSGVLTAFAESATVLPSVIGADVDVKTLDHPPSATGILSGVPQIEVFNGYVYAVAEYVTGQYFHHYVDGGTTYIADVNCPNSLGFTKAASRIFAPDGENVRFCAAGDARDWTTASDAGFLAAGLQQDTKGSVTGCGTFQDSLVVFFAESSQQWTVQTDPTANQISKRLYGAGTIEPLSIAAFAQDLVFLSPAGFRSIQVQSQSDRIDDVDVGVPVDTLVVPDITASDPLQRIRGAWIPQLGQYWCFFQSAGGYKAWVYTFSRTSKLACWSEYVLPTPIQDIAILNGKVFMRSYSSLYSVDAELYRDSSVVDIDVEVQMAFQDAKLPGVEKMFYGADYVFSGSPTVAYKYDPRDTSKETSEQTISGDTRAGELVPVEVTASAIAPVFRHSANEGFTLDLASLYFHTLGV